MTWWCLNHFQIVTLLLRGRSYASSPLELGRPLWLPQEIDCREMNSVSIPRKVIKCYDFLSIRTLTLGTLRFLHGGLPQKEMPRGPQLFWSWSLHDTLMWKSLGDDPSLSCCQLWRLQTWQVLPSKAQAIPRFVSNINNCHCFKATTFSSLLPSNREAEHRLFCRVRNNFIMLRKTIY
jgi:hypothetical protein